MLIAKQVLDYVSTLLATNESFTVIDPEVAYHEDESGTKPIVELHVSGGDFSSVGSANIGEKAHEFTIEVSVIASSSAKYDLSVIENPSSTDEDRANAIEQGERAANLAYNKIFEVYILVFGILNNRANHDFGLPKYTIKTREYGKYTIERHILNGNLATAFGRSKIKIKVNEPVYGLTPVESEEPPVNGVLDGDLPS